MRDETIENHNEIVEALEEAGFNVTSSEVDEYEAAAGEGYMGVEYTVTVFEDLSEDDEDNPYKVK